MIEYRLEDKIAIIELSRHTKRNALNLEMIHALDTTLNHIEQKTPRIIVLTGQGTAFCAGADLDGALYSQEFLEHYLTLLQRLQNIEVPILAAINGPAMGAGLQLALAADIRIMDPQAKIAVPAPKIGVTVDAWTLKKFISITNLGHATSLFFCLEEFTADKCLAIGFANRIATQTEAIEFAKVLSLMAPLTYRHYKKVFRDDGSLDEVDEDLISAMIAVWSSDDLQKGKQTRITRQLPEFTGT